MLFYIINLSCYKYKCYITIKLINFLDRLLFEKLQINNILLLLQF